ncbi:MAG: HAMP domain-containing histidine kinase [Anaerolineae bacterium]|nr:HAMP domain-containing histidine kinase [Anaerolineae bacterium]
MKRIYRSQITSRFWLSYIVFAVLWLCLSVLLLTDDSAYSIAELLRFCLIKDIIFLVLMAGLFFWLARKGSLTWRRSETVMTGQIHDLQAQNDVCQQEINQLKEELTRLDQSNSRILSNVAHDLRNSITGMALRVEIIERTPPENLSPSIIQLKNQIEHFQEWVEDVLDTAHLEESADKLRFEPTDVRVLLQRAVEIHEPVAKHAGLQLEVFIEDDLPPVWGRPNQLSRVIGNLIANAIHYTPTGIITIRLERKGDQACFQVRDTGIGIAEKDIPNLFNRFYRGDQAKSRGISGTGLGLSIVKEILDQHNGQVEVQSQVGKGTTFTIWLPGMDDHDRVSDTR